MKSILCIALVAACGAKQHPSCIEGQSTACACATGATGAQVCSGGAYGACSCVARSERPKTPGALEVRFAVKPATGTAPPMIEATVIGAPTEEIDAFTLADASRPAIGLKPSKMLGGREGPEPIALAIVINAWEMWIGNDKEIPAIREDDPSRYPGVLMDLREAFDNADLRNFGPPGSVGTIITYSDRAKVRVPMGPLGAFSGKSLGTQQDYFGLTGVEVVQGISVALDELRKRSEPRKVLIVIGDGNDTNNDAAKYQLAELKKRAAKDGVQSFAIVYKAKLSGDANIFPSMIPQTIMATNPGHFEGALRDIGAKIDNRKYLTFLGYNAKTGQGLSWDGNAHDLILRTPRDTSDPTTVTLPRWKP